MATTTTGMEGPAPAPVGAMTGLVDRIEQLEAEVASRLPENAALFPEDQITDRSSRFLAAELVREKIMRQLGAELPYQITVASSTGLAGVRAMLVGRMASWASWAPLLLVR